MRKLTTTGILLLILVILNIPTIFWLVQQLSIQRFKIVPSTFTTLQNSEIRFLIIGQSDSDLAVHDIKVQGLPKQFSWNIICTGTRHKNCTKEPTKDDLPIYILKINIPEIVNNGTYKFSVGGDYYMSGSVAAKIEIVDNITFTHPGVLLNAEMLKRLNASTRLNETVWQSALEVALNSESGKINYTPTPFISVDADTSQADYLRNDTIAAYTQALLWCITRDPAYAKNSIKIMNSWSETLNKYFTGSSRYDLAVWTGVIWPQAAEIIRYTYTDEDGVSLWNQTDIERFKSMLRIRYFNIMQHGYINGNFTGYLTTSYVTALINIGVFNDSPEIFLAGIEIWRRMLPALIYMKKDGELPVPPVFWENEFIDRVALKAVATAIDDRVFSHCPDYKHMLSGLSRLFVGSETAKIQGFDLNGESTLGTPNFKRLASEVEYNFKLLNNNNNGNETFKSRIDLCHGKIIRETRRSIGEIIYNDLVYRRNISLPNTELYMKRNRLTKSSLMPRETLSHYQNP